MQRRKKQKPIPISKIENLQEQLRNGQIVPLAIAKELGLSAKQIEFADAFFSEEYGHDTTAVAQALYNIEEYSVASKSAYNVMKSEALKAYIRIIFVGAGLSKPELMFQLAKVCIQDTDKKNKVAAIALAAKLAGYIKDETNVNLIQNKIDLSHLSNEQLEKLIGGIEDAGRAAIGYHSGEEKTL